MMLQYMLLLVLVFSAGYQNAVVSPGIMLNPPDGYFTYNKYPTLNSTDNGPVYDPNFIPGFSRGLTNISVSWSTGPGFAQMGYWVGPWKYLQVGMPHLAVGPQCCNFQEIPRTQQYRRVDWGDYYYVKAGFLSPGVNFPNYTSDFTAPAFVGLRTDWNWTVSVSLDWKNPRLLLNPENEWFAVGVAVTQYVPSVPEKLVYTVLNFWMDANSSRVLASSSTGSYGYVETGPRIVVYHLLQLSNEGNQTITVNLSPYLDDTLHILNFTSTKTDPPVISYVYLNVEGYNVQWNSTLYSFFVLSDHSPTENQSWQLPLRYLSIPAVLIGLVCLVYLRRKPKKP
jgi:hypothetical protein